jgi:hypothetical protein
MDSRLRGMHCRRPLRSLALGAALALTACASSKPAAPEHAAAPQPKVVVEGRVVGQVGAEGALEFLARAKRAEQTAGARAVERLVEREPDRAAAAIDSGAADSFTPRLRVAFESGVGQRWRALAAQTVALETATTRGALDAQAWSIALESGLTLRDPALLARLVAMAPRATDPARVRDAWCRVGEWQLERGAPGEAVLAARRGHAVDAPDDARAEAGLVWIEVRAARALGERGRALELLGELDTLRDPGLRNAAAALRGVIAAEAGDLLDARRWLESALAGGDAWSGAARAHHDLAGVLFQLGDDTAGASELERAVECGRASGDAATEARALGIQGAWHASRGEREAADTALARMRELVLREGLLLSR